MIKANGKKFFTGSCVVTLRAEDPRYQCSKLCFTVDSFKIDVCDLRLAFYDTGVWNYGAAAASWVSRKLYTWKVVPFHSSPYSLRFHLFWGLLHVLMRVEMVSCVVRFVTCINDSGNDFMIYTPALNPNWNFRRLIGSLFIIFFNLCKVKWKLPQGYNTLVYLRKLRFDLIIWKKNVLY